MIINVRHFVAEEQPYWDELAVLLDEFEKEPTGFNDIAKLKRMHYLYQRTSADLARIMSYSSEQTLKEHLESLVSRAYGEIHETRRGVMDFSLFKATFLNIPVIFQKYRREFVISTLVFLVGSFFGAAALKFDPSAKSALMPFEQLLGDPNERVAHEEKRTFDRLEGNKSSFSSSLWVHNTQVSVTIIALGMTWGLGTLLMLFYNGVMLGAVAIDYAVSGQTRFLLGWLLPHGVIEIPAILVAGQIGLILGGAMMGRGDSSPLALRLRQVSPDILILVMAVVLMLCWAGFVEAFISQYHWPVISYDAKIVFGCVEFMVMAYFFSSTIRNKLSKPKS